MNVRHSLIWQFMLYAFELGHNATEATKNICCTKSEGTVDHNTVTRWLKKNCLFYENLDNQAKSDRLDSETMFKEYQTSLASHSPVWFVTFTNSAKAFRAG